MATMQRVARVGRRLFTTDEYECMAETGLLGEDERIELVGGEIVRMAAMGTRHARCIQRLTERLVLRLQGVASVRVQLPIMIPDLDEPEPDLAVVRRRDDDYLEGHPTPADVLIAIEVSDTSLAYDRRVKLPLYARAGIPEAWLTDLAGDAVERHTEPSPHGYRRVERFGRGETITSATLPQLSLSVDEVLG